MDRGHPPESLRVGTILRDHEFGPSSSPKLRETASTAILQNIHWSQVDGE